jgi:hypothetical protein
LQTVTLKVTNAAPVTGVSVGVVTDNKTDLHALSRISGSDTNGVWEGSWRINDSYVQTYGLALNLTSTTGTYSNTMYFRK